jgi:hypothetical protein
MTFKRAEDEQGYILRLWNAGSLHGPATVEVGAFAKGVATAERVAGTELPLRPPAAGAPPTPAEDRVVVEAGRVRVHIHPAEFVTLRLTPSH